MMSAMSSTQRRILLVDDDPITLELIRLTLQNAGYQTLEATSGHDALALAQQIHPDLALLDAVMPGMSGIELARHLREETDVPFMFVSSSQEIEIIRQATEHGAIGYLLKPFDVAQIVPAVEAALAGAVEIKKLRRSEGDLTNALNAGRETSMAVGLLMAKFKTDRDTAFEVLRTYSRSNRCKISEVASRLLAAEEMFNHFNDLFLKQSHSS
jgi:response regulator NasT